MPGIPHPYLTSSLPGVGGAIKTEVEDFVVEEVPAYSPCGEGEHVYFEVEKSNLSTPEALEILSRRLGVRPSALGYAGLKDRKGVTRQTISVAGVEPERLTDLEFSRLRVLRVSRHTNKLRIGHLRGNRFEVRIRGVVPDALGRANVILELLSGQGIPNYYGFQRFGNRAYSQFIGRAFLQADYQEAVKWILGRTAATENNPHIVRARELFDTGRYEEALEAYPHAYREERGLLQYLLRHGENYAGAVRQIRETGRKLYCSAYQAYLFNLCVAERLRRTDGDLSKMLPGDLAFLHGNGAVFRVEDVEEARARAATFEISPSGPIFGRKMSTPEGEQRDIEGALLDREGTTIEEIGERLRTFRLEGGRRPLRVAVQELEVRCDGGDLLLKFFLPKGCYGTTLLREIMKNDDPAEGFYRGEEEAKHRLWRP